MNERPSPEPAQEETLFHVLRTLDANPRTSQRGLASHNSRNKLAYAWLLTPAGVAAKTSLTARS